MTDPQTKPRRIIPPAMPVPLVAPPKVTHTAAPAVPKPPRRRRNRALALIASIIFALVLVQAAVYAYVVTARRTAADRLHNSMMLAHKDSLKSATWVGYLTQGDTYYCLMSFRDDNAYVKDFLKTLRTPASVLVLLVSNKDATPHNVDLSGATLHFADASTRPALDNATVLNTATADRAAAILAFPSRVQVAAGEQLWGKLLFIPPDTNLAKLVSVTVKVDGKDGAVKGELLTEKQKEDRMLDSFKQKRAEKQ